jgi:N-hydroxyarylamine O-acetyltransferase
MFDLDSYLARIGLQGRPSIAEVHRAHNTTIPFENLDSHMGLAVSLDEESLQRKMVQERRGGYCFEQNLLLKAALEALGAEVDAYLARVRWRANGAIRPRGHVVLRVRDGAGEWHADVGFGRGAIVEPIPFGPGAEHEQDGWRFRVVEDGPEYVLQTIDEGEWADVYAFPPHPVPMIDLETTNWWVSTNPGSPFVAGLIFSIVDRHGKRTSLSDWGELALTEQTPDATTVTPVEREEIPGLLAERFGLPGFAMDAAGRVVLGAD